MQRPEACECLRFSITGVPERELGADTPITTKKREVINFDKKIKGKNTSQTGWKYSSWREKGYILQVYKWGHSLSSGRGQKTKQLSYSESDMLNISSSLSTHSNV